mgnify:CR=1 FL=1
MKVELMSMFIAFNAGLLAIMVLRPVWRRYFGSSASYALWLLAPLAALATQLPSQTHLQPIARVWKAAAPALTDWVPTQSPAQSLWPIWLWALGALLVLSYFCLARWRLEVRLRGQPLAFDARCGRVPIVRGDFGPALIGLWRPRLVLPGDFEQRYTAAQQNLVLQHEMAHVAAADLWVRSAALLLTIAQWFNPLAWLALPRLIEDQECACDARVLANRTNAASEYAHTLLVNSNAQPCDALLCSLHRTHPLIRRLAMLNRQPKTMLRRRLAATLTALSLICCAAIAWAGSAKESNAAIEPDYHVALNVQIDEMPAQDFALGTRAGEEGSAVINAPSGDIELSVVVNPTTIADQILLSMVIKRGGIEIGRPAIAFKLGGEGRIEIGGQQASGYQGIRLDASILPWNEMVNAG